MDLRFDDHVAQRLLLSGRFEPEVSTAIFALVRPGMTVLDIGANIGVHTLHLAKLVGETGRVLAFEPNPVASEELHRNIALNQVKNVTMLKVALWERDGDKTFHFPENGMEAMGGLLNTSRFKVAYEAKVETARLDTILARLDVQKVDFVKIDVEGAELPVLKGADSLFSADSCPPILYESALINSMPYLYTPDDLHQFLSSKGYMIEMIDVDNYLALPNSVG